MDRREKRVFKIWLILILFVNAFAFAGSILLQSIWIVMIVLAVSTIDLYWFYVR